MKPVLYTTLIILIIIQSCRPPVPFISPVVNTPTIKEKSDKAIYATGGLDHIELQGSYALTNRLGIAGSTYYRILDVSGSVPFSTNHYDMAGVFYYPIEKDKKYIDFLLGGGYGQKYIDKSYPLLLSNDHSIYSTYRIASKYKAALFQIDYRAHLEEHALIFSVRASHLWFSDYSYDNTLDEYYIPIHYREKNTVKNLKTYCYSPALTYIWSPKGSWVQLKFQCMRDCIPNFHKFYSSQIFSGLPDIRRFTSFSFGLTCDFENLKKKPKKPNWGSDKI